MTRLNTIDCSPIECNRLLSWFLWGNRVGGRETLISRGNTDGQEGAGLEPGSLFRRIQPHLYEFAGARIDKPTINKPTELCEVMGVHPLTLLTLAYVGSDQTKIDRLLVQVRQELDAIVERRTDD